MEINTAIQSLSALAHRNRLEVFRWLVRHSPDGLPAGEIAEHFDMPNNTLSSHLAILTRAGLLRSDRRGRNIIYSVRFDGVQNLLKFLMEDCCRAQPGRANDALKLALGKPSADVLEGETQ
ncbi:MAG: metalloregulator ArsR/SmtB family transcription factor [Pseudomonadota bacterium]